MAARTDPDALVDLWPRILACRVIEQVDAQLASSLGLDPARHVSAGLITCDEDDALYVALDEATKHAGVDVVFAKSFYAGAKHASGPFSGEILGVLAGADPDEVAEGVWACTSHLKEAVRFQTFPGDDQPAFLAHVVTESGAYLAPQAGVAVGDPIAYLIAPPLESVFAVDAALKAADVKLGKLIPPPSETNFGGAFLSGTLGELQAARDAFVEAVRAVARSPKQDARRPNRLRR